MYRNCCESEGFARNALEYGFEIPRGNSRGNPVADGIGRRFERGHRYSRLFVEKTGILASNTEVRNAIKNNAISINKQKITEHTATVGTADLLHGRFLMVENGKKDELSRASRRVNCLFAAE